VKRGKVAGACAAAVSLGLGCLLVPVLPAAAGTGAPCATSQLQSVPGGSQHLAGSVPVVFIHGIISGARLWKVSAPGSMAYQAARMSGVTAWTFGYGPESLDWVTNPAIGPAFAAGLSCLASASHNKVIVVAHSMGGLATQYALATDDPHGGTVGDHVAEVITIGTPYRGSELLTAMQLARRGDLANPEAVLGEAVLSACAGHTSGPCALPAVLSSQVGQDLQLNSAAIARLPAWPEGVPVLDIAGDMGLRIGVGPFLLHRFDVGDVAVTVGSATAHGTAGAPVIKHCNSLKLIGALYGNPGPCFHTHLVNDGDIITKVLTVIRSLAEPTAIVGLAPVSANGQPRAGETIIRKGRTQECEAGSDAAGQVYRCFAASGIYDPCWLDNADPAQATMLCQEHPWDTRIVQLKAAQGGLSPFLGPAQPIDRGFPWAVQLSDGEKCIAEQGTHDSYKGKIIDYACGNTYRHVLLRTLNRASPQWTYHSAYFDGASSYTPGPVERVSIAWYANPDNGAAVDARANDCTATALGYAAEAYEAAHNDPNGPEPEINAQACDAGYAEMIFTQSAPPPGYTAAYAFKASASGWQVVGSADYIPPGQFGIPANIGKAINHSLASAPQTEHVIY
jgi:pimeloyl-ACP methyl ester carboxylesterase